MSSLHSCVLFRCVNISRGMCPFEWWWSIGFVAVVSSLWTLLQWTFQCMYLAVQIPDFCCLRIVSEMEMLVHTCVFSTRRDNGAVLPGAERDCPLLCILASTGFCHLFYIFRAVGTYYLPVISICVFSNSINIEHLFLCSLDMRLLHYKGPVYVFCSLFCGLLVFW